jgi:exopolyphosphatase/pppGpp-phosphohydrolase
MKRLAIIDLGTNTFNILIAETTSDNKFKNIA